MDAGVASGDRHPTDRGMPAVAENTVRRGDAAALDAGAAMRVASRPAALRSMPRVPFVSVTAVAAVSAVASGASASSAASAASVAPITPLAWIALHALALWPHGAWVWQRARDGSDDPLGLMALAMLAWVLWRDRAAMRVAPRLSWLAAGLTLAIGATFAPAQVPSLVAAMLAAASLTCAIVAWLPGGTARLPLAGLALLSLPLVASLQFYVGYPLRVVTAQVSAWVLQAVGFDAARSGASMTVEGRLVIVDAPCSGVQMAWMAYFAACAVAQHTGLRDAAFVRRLPWIGVVVLVGNALRNSVLVALEARPQGLEPAWHEGIGLAALAATTLGVIALVGRSGAEGATGATGVR
jgi:exosortase/archaeosortase family protein